MFPKQKSQGIKKSYQNYRDLFREEFKLNQTWSMKDWTLWVKLSKELGDERFENYYKEIIGRWKEIRSKVRPQLDYPTIGVLFGFRYKLLNFIENDEVNKNLSVRYEKNNSTKSKYKKTIKKSDKNLFLDM